MEKLTTFSELWGSNPARKLRDPPRLGVSKCNSGVFSGTTSDLSGLPQVREEIRALNFRTQSQLASWILFLHNFKIWVQLLPSAQKAFGKRCAISSQDDIPSA